MNIADIAQIVSAVAAVLSFAGSVIVYRRTLNKNIRGTTNEYCIIIRWFRTAFMAFIQ